ARYDGQAVLVDCPPDGFEAFRATLAKALGLNATESSPDAFARQLVQSEIRVVAFDNFHRLIRPVKGGQRELEPVAQLIRAIWGNVRWVIALDRAAWPYASRLRVERFALGDVLDLPPWTEEQLDELIELRCAEAGIKPDFTKIVLPRHPDETGHESLAEHNRLGFARYLWHTSQGNPGITMRLWALSLFDGEDGSAIVQLPKLTPPEVLDRLDIHDLLALRVIAQCDLASLGDIAESLQSPKHTVQAIITAMHQREWLEEIDGRYRISWHMWRPIARALQRTNLLPRRL
nr:hypothetical protein [Alphaproteobacteria bacterium]